MAVSLLLFGEGMLQSTGSHRTSVDFIDSLINLITMLSCTSTSVVYGLLHQTKQQYSTMVYANASDDVRSEQVSQPQEVSTSFDMMLTLALIFF